MTSLLFFPSFFASSSLKETSLNTHKYRLCNLSSNNRYFTVQCASSTKKTRVRKKTKSNEELRSEIMEFISYSGFPEGHVPSMKELMRHGRNDLANIVRRRGYAFIKDLLANTDSEEINQGVEEKILASRNRTEGNILPGKNVGENSVGDRSSRVEGDQSSIGEVSDFASDGIAVLKAEDNISVEQNGNGAIPSKSDEAKDEVGNEYFSTEVVDNRTDRGSMDSNKNQNTAVHSSIRKYGAKTLTNQILGECNTIEDDAMSADTYDSEHDSCQDFSLSNHVDKHLDASHSYSENVPVSEHYTSPGSTANNVVNGPVDSASALTLASVTPNVLGHQTLQIDDTFVESPINASLREKVARFIENGKLEVEDYGMSHENGAYESDDLNKTSGISKISSATVNPELQEHTNNNRNGSGIISKGITAGSEGNSSAAVENHSHGVHSDFGEDSYVEDLGEKNQVEIDRLKFLLNKKELELSRLKEQIEKEKLALVVLQKKAENEISKAQELISEKDAELQAAEESLSGLEEVEVQFCGNGEVAEVTGSFNGWQHRIGMELKPLTIDESAASRSLKCWSTLLWLYPGTYEIKFIVDGQWILDPQRECVTKGHITNNILRVNGRNADS